MIEVLITAIRKGHIIITYCKLTSKGMKRFPFFQLTNHHTPIVQSSLSAALHVDSPVVALSESFSKNWFCCTGRVILLHLLKISPTFLKHQFSRQNCRCGTYHSVKAMAYGHLETQRSMLKFASSGDGVYVFIWKILSPPKKLKIK